MIKGLTEAGVMRVQSTIWLPVLPGRPLTTATALSNPNWCCCLSVVMHTAVFVHYSLISNTLRRQLLYILCVQV